MEGRVICALSYWLLERQRRRGGKEGVREEEREGRPRGGMRDGWLTQSGADVRRGMGCPSIERAIRLTTLDLIDTPAESFAAANRHITLVCKLVAELPGCQRPP